MESILAPTFRHIDSDGRLLDRAQEVAAIEKVSFAMNPSERLVDITGDTAVIHRVNTLIDNGKVLARERFTDVSCCGTAAGSCFPPSRRGSAKSFQLICRGRKFGNVVFLLAFLPTS